MTDNISGFSESFILGLIAATGAFIGIIFSSVRKSRCLNISCCWGLLVCNRDVLTLNELEKEPNTPKLNTVIV